MTENPYAAPKANVAEALPGLPTSTPIAGKGARFANLLIDWLCAYIFIILCAFVAGVAFAALGNTTWYQNPLLNRLIGMVFYSSYYLLFEAAFGWTPGKLVTGTRVVDEDGRK